MNRPLVNAKVERVLCVLRNEVMPQSVSNEEATEIVRNVMAFCEGWVGAAEGDKEVKHEQTQS